LIIALLTGYAAYAQTVADALMFSQVRYEGSARTMAMGNAFTALGGDIGAISINPASSGVYRYSQFAITPGVNFNGSTADYLGYNTSETRAQMTLPSVGAVFTFDSGKYRGLLNFNLGFSSSRTADFNSVMSAGGVTEETSKLASIASSLQGIHYSELEQSSSHDPFTTTNISWPSILAWKAYLLANIPGTEDEYVASTENIDGYDIHVGGPLVQDYYRRTTGGINEFSINFACNVNDNLYLGANLNVQSVKYVVNESFVESTDSPDLFQDGFKSMRSEYWQSTAGAGINLKLGAIFTPLSGLRAAATVTTPTWYNLTDNWQNNMSSAFNNSNSYQMNSPTGAYHYKVTSPMRFSLGLAYTIGKAGLISVDYERVNYSKIKMKESDGSTISFRSENDYINDYYRASNIFRAGAEVWVMPAMAFRIGYNYYGNPGDGYLDNHSAAAGIGFKFGNQNKSGLDIAYQRMFNGSEYFALYSDYGGLKAPVGTVNNFGNKISLTYSIKF